jgi:hypothetical protein
MNVKSDDKRLIQKMEGVKKRLEISEKLGPQFRRKIRLD